MKYRAVVEFESEGELSKEQANELLRLALLRAGTYPVASKTFKVIELEPVILDAVARYYGKDIQTVDFVIEDD